MHARARAHTHTHTHTHTIKLLRTEVSCHIPPGAPAKAVTSASQRNKFEFIPAGGCCHSFSWGCSLPGPQNFLKSVYVSVFLSVFLSVHCYTSGLVGSEGKQSFHLGALGTPDTEQHSIFKIWAWEGVEMYIWWKATYFVAMSWSSQNMDLAEFKHRGCNSLHIYSLWIELLVTRSVCHSSPTTLHLAPHCGCYCLTCYFKHYYDCVSLMCYSIEYQGLELLHW